MYLLSYDYIVLKTKIFWHFDFTKFYVHFQDKNLKIKFWFDNKHVMLEDRLQWYVGIVISSSVTLQNILSAQVAKFMLIPLHLTDDENV